MSGNFAPVGQKTTKNDVGWRQSGENLKLFALFIYTNSLFYDIIIIIINLVIF